MAEKEPQAETPLYGHSFFDKELRGSRKLLVQTLFLPLLYTSLLMWACLSMYWGSLLPNNNLTKLTVAVVDLDGGFLGQQVIQGIQASNHATSNHLNWLFGDNIKTDADSRYAVLDEQTWAVLQGPVLASPYPRLITDQALQCRPMPRRPWMLRFTAATHRIIL